MVSMVTTDQLAFVAGVIGLEWVERERERERGKSVTTLCVCAYVW